MRLRILAGLACVGALGACVSPQKPLQPDFGYAVRQSIATQTADPDARYARDLPPAASGQRAADANRRYNEGRVTQPAAQTTAQVGGGGGGAGAGAGGGGGPQ